MQENKNIFVLQCKRIGISETDVEKCEDVIQLRIWRVEVQKDIASIESQQQRRVDAEWLKRSESAKVLLQLLIEKIDIKITAQKTKYAELQAFKTAAKKILNENLYHRILTVSKT